MACSKEKTKKLHGFLVNHFSIKHVGAQESLIRNEATKILDEWAQEEDVNLADKGKLFTSAVIGNLFLGYQGSYEDLTKAVDVIFTHLGIGAKMARMMERLKIWKMWQKPSVEEIEQQKEIEWAISFMRQAIEQVLNYQAPEGEEPSVCESMQEKGFTENERRAMALTLFLAGQDTTAQLLNYILLKLAQNPELQEAVLRGEVPIKNLIREGGRMFAPASLVGRYADKNLKMDVTLENGSTLTRYIQKDSVLTVAPSLMARDPRVVEQCDEGGYDLHTFDPYRWQNADQSESLRSVPWSLFGGGVHLCPGAMLAEQEIRIFIEQANQEYIFSTEIEDEMKQKTTFVNGLDGSIPIKVVKRDSPDVSINEIAS